jgi:hypothetical protein
MLSLWAPITRRLHNNLIGNVLGLNISLCFQISISIRNNLPASIP